MRALRTLTAVLLGLGLLAAACGGNPSPAASGPLLPATPDALPAFDLARYDALLQELHGKPVVVNIWASWCGPCTAEAPHLAEVSKATAGKVQFVGVDILDKRPPAQAFIQKYGWTYPSVFDANGSIRDGLGYLGVPITILYDKTGTSVFTWSGPVDPGALRTELRTLGVS